MTREISVEEAFLRCEDICRKASSTFFTSFSALPIQKRKAVHAVYALCRYLDDIADGDTRPNVSETDQLNQLVIERDNLLRSIHQSQPNNSEQEHKYRLMARADAPLQLIAFVTPIMALRPSLSLAASLR